MLRQCLIYAFVLMPLWLYGQCLSDNQIKQLISDGSLQELQEMIVDSTLCHYTDSLLGHVLHKIGVQFYLQNELSIAINTTHKALHYKSATLSDDDVQLGKSYHNLGVFYRQQYAFKKAIKHFRPAIVIYKKAQSYRAIGSLRELSACYGETGAYELAHQSILQAISLAHQMDEKAFLAECYVDLGKLLLLQNEHQPAVDTLLLADQLFRSFDLSSDAYLMRSRAGCLHNLAYAWDELEAYADAQSTYLHSLAFAKQLQDTTLIIKNIINLGITNRKAGHYKKALQNIQDALHWLNYWQDPHLKAICYDNIGDVYFVKEDYQKALNYYHQATHVLIPALDAKKPEQLPSISQLKLVSQASDFLTYLMDKAKAWRALYEQNNDPLILRKALEAYQLADQVHDLMRHQQLSQSTRHYWRKEAKKLYERALEIAYLLKDNSKAFYFFEKSKSILLLEALLIQDVQQLLPDSLAKKERSIQQKINELLLELEYAEEDTKQIVTNELFAARQAYQDLLQQLHQSHSSYYNMRYASDMITLSEALDLLDIPNRHLIHYFTGEQYVYALRISQNGSYFYRFKNDPYFRDLLHSFLAFFNVRSQIAAHPLAYTEAAYNLNHLLYLPLWGTEGLAEQSEVIILPDGQLSFIPFEALSIKDNGLQVQDYLLSHHQIQYAYSASVLKYQKERTYQIKGEGQIAFFAPFIKTNDQETALPFSEDVIQSVSQQYQGVFLRNETAGWDAFTKYSQTARILHFSTHGTSGGSSSSPAIMLSDTLLKLPQLYARSIPCQLAILSACETGLGDIQEGEGILNVGRGFAYAGAPGLTSSLWKVDDKASAQLMKSFYHYIDSGHSPAQALRHAKLDYLQQDGLRAIKSTPYYWSSLVFWGYDAPIDLERRKKRQWPWYAIGALIIIAALYFKRFMA